MAGITILQAQRLDVPGAVRCFRLRVRLPNGSRCDVAFKVDATRGAWTELPTDWPRRAQWAAAITAAVRAQYPLLLAGAPPEPPPAARPVVPLGTLPLPSLADLVD